MRQDCGLAKCTRWLHSSPTLKNVFVRQMRPGCHPKTEPCLLYSRSRRVSLTDTPKGSAQGPDGDAWPPPSCDGACGFGPRGRDGGILLAQANSGSWLFSSQFMVRDVAIGKRRGSKSWKSRAGRLLSVKVGPTESHCRQSVPLLHQRRSSQACMNG